MGTFASVVDLGSFTTAAEQLGISKSFVSKQITQLENSLGTQLLYRSTRKLSLTDEGEQFYRHCKLIVSEAEKAREELLDSENNPRGRIRVTIPQSLIISNAGDVLLKFQNEYPNIELEILATGSVQNLFNDGIDLALRIGRLEDSTLVCHKLSECMLQTVASPKYINQFGKPEFPEELTSHNCLIYASSRLGQHWPFRLPDGKEVAVNVRGNLISDDGHMIVKAALAGRGIAFGPSILYQSYIEDGSLEQLLPKYYRAPVSISALYPSKQNLSRKVKVLIDYLSEHLSV